MPPLFLNPSSKVYLLCQVFTSFHGSAPFDFYMLINESREGYIAVFTAVIVVLFDKLSC
jgi:hypothetical protein